MRTNTIRAGLVAAAMLLFPAVAQAAPCALQYFNGAAPKIVSLSASAREICFGNFAVMHSGQARSPLWSAELLTGQAVRAARAMKREGDFHEEAAVPESQRASNADYARSKFDRGHLTPSGDMPNTRAQQESFSLANIAPQAPTLNRGLWSEIEETTRNIAERDGEVYVVTGVFYAVNAQYLNGRVAIPAGFYKAIYNPTTHEAGAYVAMNVSNASYQIVSMTKLREIAGVDAFPSLPLSIKMKPADLPKPGRARVASNGGVG
jgi:endonuclease G, mitochondrial